MRAQTLVAALREFRLAHEQAIDSGAPWDRIIRVDDGAEVHTFDLRSVLLLAAEALDRPDMRHAALYRKLMGRMQAEHYDLLYERLMGEPIPEELQVP